VTPIVEVGMGAQGNAGPVATWDQTTWDSTLAGWSATDPIWEALDPCRVVSVQTTRGRDRWLDKFDAGTATVTIDDRDGAYSWDDETEVAALGLRPGRPLRVSAQDNTTGILWPVFSGFIESVTDTFAPDSAPAVQVNAQDALAQFSRIQLPADDAMPGDGELSGARVNRLLNLAAWPNAYRDVAAGLVNLQATDYSDNLGDQLGLTADSEGGAFYTTKDGTVRFRDRYWLRDSDEAKNVQATIGGADQDLCAASYVQQRDGADIVNDVQFTRVGGTLQRVQDTRSQSLFRRRAVQRTDYLCMADTDVLRLANRQLQSRAPGRPRIPSVDLVPLHAAEFDFVLRVEFGWRLEIHYDAGEGEFWPGTAWTATVLVQGIAHRIDTSGWTTTLRVDDANAFPATGWDHASWDVDVWAESL
jgi:hypothetical protein